MKKDTIVGLSSESTSSEGQTLARVLVVAYGNPLRGDDGVAWHAADQLERRFSLPRVTILRRHQLAPELAEDLSRHDVVVFVDAASSESGAGTPGEVKIEELHEAQPEGRVRFSHILSPATLVGIAAELYRAKTKALSVTLTGKNFEHGEKLSNEVAATLPALVAKLEALIRGLM